MQGDDCNEQPLEAAVAHTAPVSQYSAARGLHSAPMSHVVKPANTLAQPDLSIGPMMALPSVMGSAPRPAIESSWRPHAQEEQGTVSPPKGHHQERGTLGERQLVGHVSDQDDEVTGSDDTGQKQDVHQPAHAAGPSSEVIPVDDQMTMADSLPAQFAAGPPVDDKGTLKDCTSCSVTGCDLKLLLTTASWPGQIIQMCICLTTT